MTGKAETLSPPGSAPAEQNAHAPQGPAVELDWFLENFDDLVKRYPDHWLVIQNQRVVAVGRSPTELQEKIQALGIQRPFIARSHPDAWQSVK